MRNSFKIPIETGEKYVTYFICLATRYDIILNKSKMSNLETEEDYYAWIYDMFKDFLEHFDTLVKKEKVYTRYLALRKEYEEIYENFGYFKRKSY